ncbi:uncharacterized protein FOMMEDRAFT_149709 [Fomitiporia mediterranea MF3/22]|uniref:uncharacterized protein n=1 Tax=Fomitiporia mediterranea (strain MF3/22) TaxID=694068 RepID=UPI0004408846|nr:uncharacterized protein FOMMEDRAFT_149709 [Fomitiporia mediterranea MF3/22]EJD07203.1 hypothetical protein FOMMEDRAFT_149709 [Fomitiporia mediterranea MF3/22]
MARGRHLVNGPPTAIPQRLSHSEDGEDVQGTIDPCTRQEIPKYFREWTKFWDEDDEDVNKSNIGEGTGQPVHNPLSESRPSVPSTHCRTTDRIPTTATARQVPLPIGGHTSTSMPPLTREPTCSPQVLQTPVEPACGLVNNDQDSAGSRLKLNYYNSINAVHPPIGLNLCTTASDGQFVLGSAGITFPLSLEAPGSCSEGAHIDDVTEVVQVGPVSVTVQDTLEVSPPRSTQHSRHFPTAASEVNSQVQSAPSLTSLDMHHKDPDVRRLCKAPERPKGARGAEDAIDPYKRISRNSDTEGRAEGFTTGTDSTTAHQKQARGVKDTGHESIIEKKEDAHPSRPKEKLKEKRKLPPRPPCDANGRGFVRKLVQADGTSAKPLRANIMAKIGLERNIPMSERITCPLPGCGDVVIAEDLFSHFGSHFKKLKLPEAGPHDCLLKCGNKPLGTLAALKKHLRDHTKTFGLLCKACNGRVSRDSWESIERHLLNKAHDKDRQELGLKSEWIPSSRIAAGHSTKMGAEGSDSKNDGDNEGCSKGIKRRRLR